MDVIPEITEIVQQSSNPQSPAEKPDNRNLSDLEMVAEKIEQTDAADHPDFEPDSINPDDLLEDSEAEIKSTYQEINERFAQAAQLTQEQQRFLDKKTDEFLQAKAQIDQLEASVDWNRMLEENPGKWAAMRQQFQEQRNRLAHDWGQLSTTLKQAQDQQEQAVRQYHESQKAALLRSVPQWADPQIRARETALIRNSLKNRYGLTDAEIAGIGDARVARMMRDLVLFQQKAEQRVTKEKARDQARAKARRQKAAQARSGGPTPHARGSMDDIASRLSKRLWNEISVGFQRTKDAPLAI
jgi:hypothetical protein